jgi:methylase of polypeptide subunit release factors
MTGRTPRPLRRAIWRAWLRLRHRVIGRRYRRLVLERVDGVPLVIFPDVFNPVLLRSGVFLARNLPAPVPSNAHDSTRPRALDVGTGSGIGAIFAARLGYQVVGVDLNPQAVRCARINVLLNDLDTQVEIRPGDLFTPVAGRRFDLVIFNPPFFRGVPSDQLDRAWRAPDVIERFAAGLGQVLRPGGQARIVLSTDGEWRAMLDALGSVGLVAHPTVGKDFGNEVLTVYAVTSGSTRPAVVSDGLPLPAS